MSETGANTSATIAPPEESNQTLVPPLNDDDSYVITVQAMGATYPDVFRTLCVPASFTFEHLSTAIQIAFDLRGEFDYQFNISRKGHWSEETSNTHFLKANERYSDCQERDIRYFSNFEPNVEWKRERTRLATEALIHNHGFWGIGLDEASEPIDYWYVYGINHNGVGSAGWLYRITVHSRESFHDIQRRAKVNEVNDTQRTFCLGGMGHPIAENCNGPRHWKALKLACSNDGVNPKRTDHEDELRHWFAKDCINGYKLEPDGFNSLKWDRADVNLRLRQSRLLQMQERGRAVRLRRKFMDTMRREKKYGLSWQDAWYGVATVRETEQ